MSDESPSNHVAIQSPVTAASDPNAELEAFNKIVSAVQSLKGTESQMKVMKSVLTFLGWADAAFRRTESAVATAPTAISSGSRGGFSEDRTLSPKQFMLDKRPITDIEKVTCLAYYLTHYRDEPHFKTLDISKLNTEAAQLKFSNSAAAVENATYAGFLVPAGKGNKQLSAIGELYVQALPDREQAKAAVAHAKPRRKNNKRESASEEDEAGGALR